MRFSDLNWFDIEAYLEQDDRVMVVIGSCEQHGYLSLTTDTNIPTALADSASQQSGVVVAPPVNFGASAYFLAYPGTISLRIATLMNLVEDCLAKAEDDSGDILAPGCEVMAIAPPEKIDWFMELVNEVGVYN